MTTLNTYLNFNGNCEVAFLFYKSVYGGEFEMLQRFKDMPENPEFPISEADKNRVMHVTLPISENSVLMGSDTGGEWATNHKPGNNFSISINTESKNEADRLFKELSNGGEIIMPMEKTFWESYFGMFTDKFGINWMVSYDSPDRKK
ncbi:MAG: VOC family protein [Winogradskyella sp.]|uniref:VOC family protein n=1 Tax=Winogradskyella sp. TaxID=1883156 RepID=UPI0017C292D6|nr:VOC family protein [Winogradskyella sp.]